MARFTAYKVTNLPNSGIDEDGLYFKKDNGDDKFSIHLRSSNAWVDLGEVDDVDTVNNLKGDVKVDLTFSSGVLKITATGDGTQSATTGITIIDDVNPGSNKTFSSNKINSLLSGAGYGDMVKSEYDPTGVEGDAFDYYNLHNAPTVNNATITLTDGTSAIDTFTVNQASNKSISLGSLKTTVENNLTSSSGSNALSANQGRVLKDLIDNLESTVSSGLNLIGGFDAASETNLPGGGNATKGDTWYATSNGTVQGIVIEAGDTIVANTDNASQTDPEDWIFIQANIGQATESTAGYAKIATTAQVNAGTDNTTIVTPAKAKAAVEQFGQDLQTSTSIDIVSNQIRTKAITGDVSIAANGVSSTIANNAITTAKITNAAVTYAKIQNVAGSRLLGRSSSGAGAVQEVQLASNLEFDGSSLAVSWGAIDW